MNCSAVGEVLCCACNALDRYAVIVLKDCKVICLQSYIECAKYKIGTLRMMNVLLKIE